MHEQHPLLGIQPTLDEIGQQRGRDGRVLRRAFPEPERDLDALRGDPQRDDHHPALQLQPVEHHHRQPQIPSCAAHQLCERLAGALHERPRHRRLRRRPRPRLDLLADRLLRATVPARRHAGEHPLEHDPTERITISEMLIGRKLHLGLAVRGPNPRSLDLDTPTTERHLHHPRDRGGPRHDPGCACPSGRRHRRPPPPSTPPERRARRRRSAPTALPSLPRPAAPTRPGRAPGARPHHGSPQRPVRCYSRRFLLRSWPDRRERSQAERTGRRDRRHFKVSMDARRLALARRRFAG